MLNRLRLAESSEIPHQGYCLLKPFDENGLFRPTETGAALHRLAIRSAGITVFSSGMGLAIQMIATVVLARLLAPADFGVVTMVSTFSLLVASFGLNGFTEGILQRQQIDHQLTSTLFWINTAVGLFLTAGFAAAGSLLAWFYSNPHVTRVAAVMSINVILTNISVIHLALLKRAMRFSVLSANDILARALSVATSILLGLAGWGYWALVAGTIMLPLSTAIGAWTLCRWLPGRPRRVAGTGSMVRFAMNTYWHFVVSYSARNMDNLLVGWRFGALALGFYKKAYDLFALSASQLLSPVAPVGVAALSRVAGDPVVYKRHFLRALSILALIGMGVSADVTLIGKDLIRVLLGPGWAEAGRIFTYFGPGIGIMLIYGTHGWMHLSLGKPERWFRWGLVELVVTGLMFLLALPLGPAGIAIAWTASYWVLTVPAFWYAGQPVNFKVESVFGAVWKYFVAALAAGVACAALLWKLSMSFLAPSAGFAAVRAVVVSLGFVLLYLAAIVVLHGGFAPLLQFWQLLPDVVPWKRLRTPPSNVIPAESAG